MSSSSTATRARLKTMVWRPARRKVSAARLDRPSGPGRMPMRTSMGRGLSTTTCLTPAGAPFRLTTRTGVRPVSVSASWPGLPIVAVQQTMRGAVP